jgi:hypothetical protein
MQVCLATDFTQFAEEADLHRAMGLRMRQIRRRVWSAVVAVQRLWRINRCESISVSDAFLNKREGNGGKRTEGEKRE